MKTVVWDVDDVLNDLMREWFTRKWLPSRSGSNIQYIDLTENPPHRLLGITLGEYLESLDEFRHSDLGKLQPVPEALAWFEKHGAQCRHIALTSVPLHAAHISAGWVMRHFGRWIRSFNIVPSPRDDDCAASYDKTKEDFLGWWGKADIIVDDSEFNISTAQELGITGVMMPRPWNRSAEEIGGTFDRLAQLINVQPENCPA